MNRDAARDEPRTPHGSSDDPDVLDFSANCNPLVPDGTETVYREAFAAARTYPEEPPADYRRAAADYVGCDPDDVVPTPGGLAAIRLAIDLAVDPGDTVAVPFPSFGEYAREVRLQGGAPAFVPEGDVVGVDPDEYALVVVCTPNNPTGTAYPDGDLRDLAARCRDAATPLLVDEAFLGFTDRPSLAGEDGVIVARSLTKLFGLPGIRAGFAVATGAWGAALSNARRTWNLGAPALATGAYCMRQPAFVRETRDRVASERERLAAALRDAGYGVHDSEAPFLLLDTGDRAVDAVLAHAADAGVALRDARSFRGLDDHVRVAVRLPAENDRLLEVLRGA
ncbi:threonine-phosphate decarboxylase [Halobaculum lipolyticum]|uniref:Aminotransferase n=1 Tax=Halobaculum lipolyticum TaxID=3032001 RepID=A0ABD5WHX2_9EURY|nr:threonine-phosphate decarboxylase [Halobaculum sp. DT31]